MDEEQIIETTETNPINMYEISERDQLDNKENVVLRTLVGNPNRYTPSTGHQSPLTIRSSEKPITSMYSLEPPYQSIPPKAAPPKNIQSKIYYIDPKRTDESPIPKEIPETSVTPTAFLQTKIIPQPIVYSIVGKQSAAKTDQANLIKKEPPTPIIYSITDRPRRSTVNMSTNNVEAPIPIIDQSPTLYSLNNTPRLQNEIQEPTKQYLQPSPSFYSVVGSPARTSRGIQVSPLTSPGQPAPILYTIVNDTPPTINRPKENYPSPPIIKNQPTDTIMYTLDNEVNAPKQQQRQSVQKPTIYALVVKSNASGDDNRTKPLTRKNTPPITSTTTRRISHSLERKPEAIKEEMIPHPITKTKYQSQPKGSTIPLEEERHSRSHVPRQPPFIYTSPEQTHRKPYTVTQNQPIQLPDYHSPYAYRTYKPYREKKYNDNSLPVISKTNSERKPRPPLYEPRYRAERHHPYVPIKPTSLERYPVNTKPRSGLWDNDYQTQTDDDEDYEQKTNKKKRYYKTTRPRAPWIPVW